MCRPALANTTLLQADVTANDDADRELLKHFGIFGPPTIAFYGADGDGTAKLPRGRIHEGCGVRGRGPTSRRSRGQTRNVTQQASRMPRALLAVAIILVSGALGFALFKLEAGTDG